MATVVSEVPNGRSALKRFRKPPKKGRDIWDRANL
jgi:hypothetical protein